MRLSNLPVSFIYLGFYCTCRVRPHRAVDGAGEAVHDGLHCDRHPALHALRGQHRRHPGQGLQVDLLQVSWKV